MTSMLELLLEEWKLERTHREEEKKQREEERKRQEEQLAAIYKLVEKSTDLTSVTVSAGAAGPGGGGRTREDKVELVKLMDGDDIEAFLTTFERLMEAYGVEEDRWAFKLAPQLTGKAQQAYAALPTEEAKRYQDLKQAILHRYDINAETYRQRFRKTKKSQEESYRELVVRQQDLLGKWMKECTNLAELRETIVMEQFLNAVPTEVQVWVKERKPKTAKEAGELADQYDQAQRQARDWNRQDSQRKADPPDQAK